MAARAITITGMITPVERCSVAGFTPEFYFQKMIDNSRLVRQADPQRRREIRVLTGLVSIFFLVTIVYTWQHLRSLEYGYQIETLKSDHERLVQLNRNLTLEQSWLRDPHRIDLLAQQMDLKPHQPGQFVQLDVNEQNGEAAVARLASATIIPAQ